MKIISEHRCFGGLQRIYEHDSTACGVLMRFGAFLPPHAGSGEVPALYWLSGLTCTEQNFLTKAGAQRLAAELGLLIIAPDTSPRGEGVPDADAYDLGQGAGFYVDAKEEPWATHFRMESYIADELPRLVQQHLPADGNRQGIFGHSMGGHGALTLHFRTEKIGHHQRFKSVSAFAPLVAPTQVPWGRKAFTTYLGPEEGDWQAHDATALVTAGPTPAHILIDQGEADAFLAEQLRPELFEAACQKAGQKLTLRRQPGYDHSYYFIASFMGDHLRHHAQALKA